MKEREWNDAGAILDVWLLFAGVVYIEYDGCERELSPFPADGQ